MIPMQQNVQQKLDQRQSRLLVAQVLRSLSSSLSGGATNLDEYKVTPDEYTPPVADDAQNPDADPVAPGGTDTQPDASANYKGSYSWGGYANGRIPRQALASVGGGYVMAPDAASSWLRMVQDAAAAGVTLKLSSAYRDYDTQVSIRQSKGDKVATATPGTSIHGWGKAVDVSGAKAQKWLRENGAKYGWMWPKWAQRTGTKSYEPWHFEYVGVNSGG